MQKSRAGEPGQKGGVSHRVPCPCSAPAKFKIGSLHSEVVSHGQEKPRHDGPVPGGGDPRGIQFPRNERRYCKGKRDGEPDIPQIGGGRMQSHERVL